MASPDYSWRIDTALDPAALRAVLDPYRPFRIEVNFSSGFSTREFGDAVRYINAEPLARLHYFESHVAIDEHSRVLDIGCNLGYYCDYFIKRGVKAAVGIDFNPRLIAAATLLRGIAGIGEANYVLVHGDFGEPCIRQLVAQYGRYDLILMLGTVINAVPSFAGALLALPALLRPGGAVVFDYTALAASEPICRFHRGGEGFPDDPNHIWTYSEAFLDGFLASIGIEKVARTLEWKNRAVIGDHKRIISIHRNSGGA